MSEMDKKLDEQLKLEQNAAELYNTFIKKIDDPAITKKITGIKEDEIEHIKIVQEMMSLVKGQRPAATPTKEPKIDIDLKGFTDSFNTAFITTDVDSYPHTIINIMRQVGLPCIYLSYNKQPKHIRNVLAEHKVDTGRINFVSGVKVASKDMPSVDPEDLTGVAIAMENAGNGIKGKFFILVDPITAFSAYHKPDMILRFVSSINSKAAEYGVVWIAVNDESEKGLIDKIGPLCDKVIRV